MHVVGWCRDGLLRGELEACLMFTPPSELLVAQPISAPSQKLLGSYVTQSRALRSQSVPKDKYSQGGGLAAVTEFYGAAGTFHSYPKLQLVLSCPVVTPQASTLHAFLLQLSGCAVSSEPKLVQSSAMTLPSLRDLLGCGLCLEYDLSYGSNCHHTAIMGCSNLAEGSEASAALEKVMQLPGLIVQALAHALDYVRPLNMEAVLRYGASFKPFHDAHQMSLSPNALRYIWGSASASASGVLHSANNQNLLHISCAGPVACRILHVLHVFLHAVASKRTRLYLLV